MTYSCSQDAPYGSDNIILDPLFVNTSEAGYYYLSAAGLKGQSSDSPCFDLGDGTSAAYGLAGRTTRTDGANDADAVDLGYHYTNGIPDSLILVPVTNCFVDAVSGDDSSGDGLSWGTAWKSVSKALSGVANGATINVATGRYSAATTGESFPLTVVKANTAIIGSDPDPGLTVLDNAHTSGQRILQATGKGALWLECLTFAGGRFALGENRGAGLFFQSCDVTLTNCVVRDNTNICTSTSYGGGIYASGGSLAILNCAISNNTIRGNGQIALYGGGIAALNCTLLVRGSHDCVFSNNLAIGPGNHYTVYGGGIYSYDTELELDRIRMVGNRAYQEGLGRGYGGALYCTGAVISAAITGCLFENNASKQTAAGTSYGGAIYLSCATGYVHGCTFTSNAADGKGSFAYGGAIHASGVANLQVISNSLNNSMVVASQTGKGAALYAERCTKAVLDGTVFDGDMLVFGKTPDWLHVTGCVHTVVLNSTLQNNKSGSGLSIAVSALQTVALTNCIIVNNATNGIQIAAGVLGIANCTISDNGGWGVSNVSGTLSVKNSIIWSNAAGSIYGDALATYSCIEGGYDGDGNIADDPLFAGSGDYHLKSRAGRWDVALEEWVVDSLNSPCIDAGDPTDSTGDEPDPSGRVVNMGAYGGTAQASKSNVPGSLFIFR